MWGVYRTSDRDGGVILVSDVDGYVEGDSRHDVRDLGGLGSLYLVVSDVLTDWLLGGTYTEEDQNASSDAENGGFHLGDGCLRSR